MNVRITITYFLLIIFCMQPSISLCNKPTISSQVQSTSETKKQGWSIKRGLMYAGGALALLVTAAVGVVFFDTTQQRKIFKDVTTDEMRGLVNNLANELPKDEKTAAFEHLDNAVKRFNNENQKKVFSDEFRERQFRDSLISIVGLSTMQLRQQNNGKETASRILRQYGLATDEYGRRKKLEPATK